MATTPKIWLWTPVDVDLHTRTQITLLPTSSERLSISPALLFTKDQNTRGEIIVATKRKIKVVNKDGVNCGGNMDQGVMALTSDVFLPKDEKNLCWVNKLQLNN